MAAMNPSATLPLPRVVEWLRRFGPQRDPASRFESLLAASELAPQATLRVLSGAHAGAALALDGPGRWVGSDPQCDVVLQDDGIQPRHARILPRDGRYELVSANAPAQTIVPVLRERRDGFVEERYELGDVALTLSWPDDSPEEQPALRFGRGTVLKSLLIGGLLAVVVIGAGEFFSLQQARSPADRVARATAALGASLPPGVKLQTAADGTLVVDGLVADEPERQRLLQLLSRSGYGDAQLRVASASVLIDQLREALGAPELQIAYDGRGRVRIEGTTENAAVKSRLRSIAAERGRDDIDDRVVLVDEQQRKERTVPMPVRVTDVMLGDTPYFRTDTGARYYTGALLPDGAEVVSIGEREIVFRRGEKTVVFHLE
jgi:type III secretion protein D